MQLRPRTSLGTLPPWRLVPIGAALFILVLGVSYLSWQTVLAKLFSYANPAPSLWPRTLSRLFTSALPASDVERRLQLSCESGEAPDCVRVLDLYQERCRTQRSGAACWLAGLYLESTGGAAQAEPYYRRACEEYAPGCTALGRVLDLRNQELEARQRYAQACAQRSPQGCYGEAIMLHREGSRQDLALALLRFQEACGMGHGAGCHGAAYLYEKGVPGIAADQDRFRTYLGRACKLEHGPACRTEGALLEVAGLTIQGLALYQRACKLRDTVGCYRAGLLLCEQGRYQEAAAVYKEACDDKEAHACVALGRLYELQRVRPSSDQSPAAASAEQYQTACSLRNAKGCENYSIALREGIGVEKNEVRAEELRRLAVRYSDDP